MKVTGDRTAAYTIRDRHWAEIVEKLEYHTPRPPSWFLGTFRCVAAMKYHVLMGWDIYAASIPCKRGVFSRIAWADTSVNMLHSAEEAGCRFHVTGLENVVKAGGPVVFVSNHMSGLETLTLQAFLLPLADICYIVKKQLIDLPVFKYLMRGVEPIAVTRKNPRDDLKTVLEKGTEVLASGRSVMVFPQATRSAVFDPSLFNTLGIKLAVKAGVPVIPVALKTDCVANGRWIKDYGPVDPRKPVFMVFGPPLRIEGHGKKEHQMVVDFITSHLKEWGAIIKAPSMEQRSEQHVD